MIHEKFPTFIGRGNLINFSKIRYGAERADFGLFWAFLRSQKLSASSKGALDRLSG